MAARHSKKRPRKGDSTTELPSSLVDELAGKEDDARYRVRYNKAALGRKEARKAQRLAKRQAQHQAYLQRHGVQPAPAANGKAGRAGKTPAKPAKGSLAAAPPAAKRARLAPSEVKPRSELAEYDAAIRAAKRKLGIRKGADLKAELAEDGLDELLDVLDSESDAGSDDDAERSDDAVDEDEDGEADEDEDEGSGSEAEARAAAASHAKSVKPRSGLDQYDAAIRAAKRKLGIRHGSELKSELAEDGLDDLLDLLDSESEGEDGGSDAGSAAATSSDEDAGLDEEAGADDGVEDGSDVDLDEDDDMADGDADLDEEEEEEEDDDALEEEDDEDSSASDAATRPKSAETMGKDAAAKDQAAAPAPAGKYVPPSARKAMGEANENRVRLERLLRGLLNRLSDSNLDSILSEVQALYRKHSRNDINEILIQRLLAACTDQSSLLDTLLLVNSAFLAGLSVVIGQEVGALFLQALFEKFDSTYARERATTAEGADVNDDEAVGSKEVNNYLTLLCYLAIFEVMRPSLLLELITKVFAVELTPLDTELILNVVKHAGYVLRSTDPAGLKAAIVAVQAVAQKRSAGQGSARVRFMLDTIYAVKNNRKTKGVLDDQDDKVAPLRKWVRGLVRKSSTAHAGGGGLTVTLEDLRSAKDKGRWWLVGAAWAGRDGAGSNRPLSTANDPSAIEGATPELLQLARAQGMNTDVRRRIFVAIMGSGDYVEAFTRVIKLGLKDQQEREIVRVLLHCCKQEREYNPYYAHLARRLCEAKYAFRVTFQFAFWDAFKELDNMSQRARINVAHLLAHLLRHEGVYMGVFKPVAFQRLSSTEAAFFRLVLMEVLLPDPDTVADAGEYGMQLVRVFQRAQQPEDLRDGLTFFLQAYVRPLASAAASAGGSKALLDADDRATLKRNLRTARSAMRPLHGDVF